MLYIIYYPRKTGNKRFQQWSRFFLLWLFSTLHLVVPNCPSDFISHHTSLYPSCSYPNCLLSEPWTPQGNAPPGAFRQGQNWGEQWRSTLKRTPPHTHSRSPSGSHKCRVFALAVLTVRNTTAFFLQGSSLFPISLNISPGVSFFLLKQ